MTEDPEASEPFLPTRRSLLSRLRSWDNQDAWREFFDAYWRLLYDCATKAGLDDSAAQDAVQETVIAVAKQMPDFRYDPARGSFKGWLLQITKRRVADQFRRKQRARIADGVDPVEADWLAEEAAMESTVGEAFDRIWDAEWKTHLTQTALLRVRRQVKPDQFQMFELYALKEWPVAKVARSLGVSVMTVYLAKHRVGGLFKKEFKQLETKMA